MPSNLHGFHHFQKRRRVHVKLEPYPHPDKLKRTIDLLIWPVIVLGLLMTLPQIKEVLIDRNVAGVSTITWATYVITSFFWFVYGWAHKEKPIIISSVLWIIANALVVIGTLL